MKNLIFRIKRILNWFPIIWKDFDWDHHYFFAILEHKLRNMEKFFREDASFVGKHKVAKKINICRMLTTRILKNNYLNDSLRWAENKWGESHLVFIDNGDTVLHGCFTYDKATTPEEITQAGKDYMKWGMHADKQKEQDLDYLFFLLRKNVEYWWD